MKTSGNDAKQACTAAAEVANAPPSSDKNRAAWQQKPGFPKQMPRGFCYLQNHKDVFQECACACLHLLLKYACVRRCVSVAVTAVLGARILRVQKWVLKCVDLGLRGVSGEGVASKNRNTRD